MESEYDSGSTLEVSCTQGISSMTVASEGTQPGNPNRPVLKVEVISSFQPHPNQTEPPRQEVQEQVLPTLNMSFFCDLTKPFNLSIPLPVTKLSSLAQTSNTTPSESQADSSSPWQSGSRHRLPITFTRNNLRAARQRALSRIGIQTYSNEKRLLAAVRNNNYCTVVHLLEDGVNPNVSDAKKRTPLHLAASQGYDHIVSSLTAMRADPNKIDILGNSPLHLAVCRGDTRTVRVLIGSGANIHLKDNLGRTPLDLVKGRLNTLRTDRSISTDKLIGECQMICDVLKIHAARLSHQESAQVDALCSMMAGVSTREQADELAEAVMNQMSGLSIEHEKNCLSLL